MEWAYVIQLNGIINVAEWFISAILPCKLSAFQHIKLKIFANLYKYLSG